jgi:hypothetical protein
MCWNAPVSLASFLSGLLVSFGMGFLALKQKKIELAVLSFGWSWVICMQLFEYFIWTHPEDNNVYARWAFVFNITQILLLGLLFLTFFDHPTPNKIAVCSILFVYVFYMLYYAHDAMINISKQEHLQYNWWETLPLGNWVYILSLCAVFLLIIRPFAWSLRTLGVIIFLLLISTLFYSNSIASMWCWFSVSVPIFSYLLYF